MRVKTLVRGKIDTNIWEYIELNTHVYLLILKKKFLTSMGLDSIPEASKVNLLIQVSWTSGFPTHAF